MSAFERAFQRRPHAVHGTARRRGRCPLPRPPFTDREEAESRARWETAKRRQAERAALGGTDLATLGVLAAALVGLGQAERAGWVAPADDAPLPAPGWDQVATEVDDALTRLTLSWRPPAEALLAKETEGTGAEVLGPYWSTLGSGAAEGEDRPRPAPAEGRTTAAAPATAEAPASASAPRAEATETTPSAPVPVSFAEAAMPAEAVPQGPEPVPIRLAEDASGSAPSTAPMPEGVARAEDAVGRPAAVASATPDEAPSARADAPRADPPGLAAATPAAAPGGPADVPGLSVAEAKPGAEPVGEADRDTPPGLAIAATSPGRADPPGPPDEARDTPPGLAVAATTPGRDEAPAAAAPAGDADPPGLAVGLSVGRTEEPAPRLADATPDDVALTPPDTAASEAWAEVVVARLAAAPADDLPPGLARLAEAAADPGRSDRPDLPDTAVAHGARAADAIL
jgi:hypothetical protein